MRGDQTEPDAMFASYETFRSGRLRQISGRRPEGVIEVEGTPDMVLEVISRSSVRKDTVDLLDQYWQAGIREYWLIDPRREPIPFDILRHTARGYVATRRQNGWLKSVVFGKSFQLLRSNQFVEKSELRDFSAHGLDGHAGNFSRRGLTV